MPESCLVSNENSKHTLLVWDTEGTPTSGDWTTVLWSSFDRTDPNAISIPWLVEEQADALRSRYLAWIYDLGETRVKGKRLVDHLELRPGFSYWWMTSLAQKFNASGSSQISNAIKTLVLESLVLERNSESLILVSSNVELASVLQRFCRDSNLAFIWNLANKTEKPKPLVRRIYSAFPYPLQALVYFIWYLAKGFPLLLKKQVVKTAFKGKIGFVDVLVHLDKQAFTTGKFISNYWTSLVDKLVQLNVKTNWLHNYFCQKPISTLVRAQRLIVYFNKSSCEIQTHALIETNLSLSIFIKTLKDYFRTSWASYHVSTVSRHFQPTGSALNLWPLFKQEWIDSLRGQCAMVNCLRISLYEKTFSNIPHQKIGVYLQENQPWEMALIYTWRAAGHGKLIGVPHTNVRFWDLRYFYDSRSYNCADKNVLPIPDLVAVNGPIAKKTYHEGGYPNHHIAEVEALRFIHLLNHASSHHASNKTSSGVLRVLVCGDFLEDTNYKILSWLSIAAEYLPKETVYILKPHPAYAMKIIDFPSLSLEMSEAPLSELFENCDLVFTSNITSAAVDAYCSGIPVVQMIDGNTFNLSPLRGLKGAMYVTNPMELAEALLNAQHREPVVPEPFFYLDEALPRWRKLLELSSADSGLAAIS